MALRILGSSRSGAALNIRSEVRTSEHQFKGSAQLPWHQA